MSTYSASGFRGCTRRHGRLRFWRLPRVIRTKFCSRFDYQLKRQQERFVVPSVFCDHSNYWISLAKKIGRWSGFALRCLIRLRLSCLEQNCWFFWTILAFLRQQYVLFFFFFFGIQTRILCITFAINTSNAFIINTVNIVTLKMIFFFFITCHGRAFKPEYFWFSIASLRVSRHEFENKKFTRMLFLFLIFVSPHKMGSE